MYSLKEKHGATCYLPEVGVLTTIESSRAFKQYVLDNIQSWYEGIEKTIEIRLEELIIVRGYVKSPRYKVTAIYSRQETTTVDVDVNALNVLDIGMNMRLAIHHQAHHEERSLPVKDTMSSSDALAPHEPRPSSPHGTGEPSQSWQSPTKTPSIFLRYYKMKRRLGIFRTLKAGAGPHVLPPGEDPSYDAAAPVFVDESDAESSARTVGDRFNHANCC